jgi:hypothetical protein
MEEYEENDWEEEQEMEDRIFVQQDEWQEDWKQTASTEQDEDSPSSPEMSTSLMERQNEADMLHIEIQDSIQRIREGLSQLRHFPIMDDHDGMMASLLAPVCLFTMHNVPVATSRTPGGRYWGMVTSKIQESGVEGLIQSLLDFDPYSIDYHTAVQVKEHVAKDLPMRVMHLSIAELLEALLQWSRSALKWVCDVHRWDLTGADEEEDAFDFDDC